jgi:hypothetical protein
MTYRMSCHRCRFRGSEVQRFKSSGLKGLGLMEIWRFKERRRFQVSVFRCQESRYGVLGAGFKGSGLRVAGSGAFDCGLTWQSA